MEALSEQPPSPSLRPCVAADLCQEQHFVWTIRAQGLQ